MPVLDMFSLKGKVALVTGGAGLYGRQIVRGVAEAGAKTFVASRTIGPLEKLAAEHRKAGLDVTALSYDRAKKTRFSRCVTTSLNAPAVATFS